MALKLNADMRQRGLGGVGGHPKVVEAFRLVNGVVDEMLEFEARAAAYALKHVKACGVCEPSDAYGEEHETSLLDGVKKALACAPERMLGECPGLTGTPSYYQETAELVWSDVRHRVVRAYREGRAQQESEIEALRPRKTTPDDQKSWTQAEVDVAIQRYKQDRGNLFDGWAKRVTEGDSSASREARKVFGRNVIARKLRIPRAMVSHSPDWQSLAKQLGLEGRKTARPAPEKVGLEIAEEKLAESKKDSEVEEQAARNELLEKIRDHLSKADHAGPEAKPMSRQTRESLEALEEKLQRGAITSEEADETYHLIFQQSMDRGQRSVPGQL